MANMGSISFRSFTFLLIIVFLIWSSSMETCNARKGKHWRHSRGIGVSLSKKKGKNHSSNYHRGYVSKAKKKSPSPQAPPLPPSSRPPSHAVLSPSPPKKGYGNPPSTTIFNVLDFGAKGDGATDDTKAFQAAWAAACKVKASIVFVPSESVFLVGPISFSGPYCQHDIVFQVNLGTTIWILLSQGGSGSVQGILFSNIQVSEVQLPIIIDQFYCDKSSCKNQSSAVALSGIHYEKIRGTYTVKPVHLACSDSIPCTEVTLTGIELKPLQERYHMYDPYCWHTFGELYSPTEPPIECLQIGKPSGNMIQADHDSC